MPGVPEFGSHSDGASGNSTPSNRPSRFGDSERNTVPVGGFTSSMDSAMPPLNLTTSPVISPSLGPRVTASSPLDADHVVSPALPLIPQPLPTSSLLYVLTASEGRDKMFKLLQYSLKLCISVLVTKDLFPPDAQRFADYWSGRLQRNISTIRKGRSLFKLGRWIVTLLHIKTIVDRLRDQSTLKEADSVRRDHLASCAIAAKEAEERDILQGSPTRSSSTKPRRSVAFTEEVLRQPLDGKKAPSVVDGEPSLWNPVLDSSDAALPVNCRKSGHDFSRWGMWLLLVRNVASVIRNIMRDVLFLSQTELLGFSASANHSIRGPWGVLKLKDGMRIQSMANIMWFMVSCSDLFFNSIRLFDKGWITDAMTPENRTYCACNLRSSPDNGLPVTDPAFIRRKCNNYFPNLDMDFGSVTPTTAKFFEAAPPSSMCQCCSVCGCLLHTVPTEGEEGVEEGVMVLPLFLRKSYGLVWCVLNHSNFLHTILLQLRYTADVFLSYKFAFGDYEILVGQEGRLDTNNRLYLGSIAGLISSAVALLRVSKAAGS